MEVQGRNKMSADRKRFDTTQLPYNEDLTRFAPEYTPEVFTKDEQKYLKPFFSNLDKPIFVTYNLPEEINAALDSRYSRSTKSKRRLFIDEYVNPIISPEKEKDWAEKSEEEKQQSIEIKDKFNRFINFLDEEGGFNDVVNIQRARGFFEKWLSGYGDDSIAEMGGGFHVSCEGISSIVIEEMISQRIGISPLVKSSRYVSFSEKTPDGKYMFHTPGEIKGTKFEERYDEVMNLLFDTYSYLEVAYLQYIKEKFPKGEDESDGSYIRSRGAKRFDDIRDILPFSALNKIGLSGNGRAYESLINRLLSCELGEARWVGQTICKELESVAPSFVKRPQTERGAEVQLYRRNSRSVRNQIAEENFPFGITSRAEKEWANLVSSTPNADVEILAFDAISFDASKTLKEWKQEFSVMTPEERKNLLKTILDERKSGKEKAVREQDRFKKVPRSFERAIYAFDLWARGGDMRDLRRHRMVTEGHGPMTVSWGIDLEKEVMESPFLTKIYYALKNAEDLFDEIEDEFGSEVAQYCVPFAFIQHWSVALSARELYWIGELRTGPQARPHYKEVVLNMVDAVMATDPGVFQEIMVDRNDYRLARRESEKRQDKK